MIGREHATELVSCDMNKNFCVNGVHACASYVMISKLLSTEPPIKKHI